MSSLLYYGIPIFALIVNILLLLSLLFARKNAKVIAFICYVCCIICWVSCSLLMKIDGLSNDWVVIFNRLCTTFSFLTPLFIYIYLNVYTKNKSLIKTILIAIGIVICILINFGAFGEPLMTSVAGTNVIDGKYHFEYTYNKTLAAIVFVYFFFTILVILAKSIYLIYRRKATFNQIGIFLIGSLIMFAGFVCNMTSIGKYPIDILATLITALLLFVFLYRRKMFEFKIIISQGTVLFLILVGFTVGYAFILKYIVEFVNRNYAEYSNYVLVIVTLLLAVILQPLLFVIKNILNKYMNKYANSQQDALNKFQINISNNLDIDNISDELLATVNRALHTPKSCLLLHDSEKSIFKIYKCSSVLENINIKFDYNSPIIDLFAKQDNYVLNINDINMIPELKSMWESEKKELKYHNIQLIIPLKCRQQVIGLLLLLPKDDNRKFNSFDYEILKTLAAMTGVALDNAYLFQEAQKEAYYDSLTGLYNHKYFVNTLSKMLSEDRKKHKTISLLMIDLDNFKLYNDLYGFKEGDEAILRCAEIMIDTLREKGVICRYSGQEFAILLPGCDSYDAFQIGENIRRNIETGFTNHNDAIALPGVLTTSIGLSNYPLNALDENELIKNALFALYVAKNSGKNNVVEFNKQLKTGNSSEGVFDSDKSIMSKYRSTIYALTAAIDTKDHYTFAHSQNVAYYTVEIAKALGLDDNTVMLFEEAALLHDIGKIGIPESILSKTGRLTDEEYRIMKTHVELCVTTIKFLPSTDYVIPIIFSHHERYDGKGYPRGLKGVEIPLGGRILAVADAFDAMLSKRSYKEPLSLDYAIGELSNNMDKQFDKDLVKVFVKLIEEEKIDIRTSNAKTYRNNN